MLSSDVTTRKTGNDFDWLSKHSKLLFYYDKEKGFNFTFTTS